MTSVDDDVEADPGDRLPGTTAGMPPGMLGHPAQGYTFAVAEDDARGVQCTIYPRDVPKGTLVTTWITAPAADCVDLLSVR